MEKESSLWEDIEDDLFRNIDADASNFVRIIGGGDCKKCDDEEDPISASSVKRKLIDEDKDEAGTSCNDDGACGDGPQKKPDLRTPLERYRRGYLSVTDLVNQIWCEQEMVYKFTVPVVVVENPVITAGQDIHLSRELEVHDVVKVAVQSSEDIFAIKVLNLLGSVKQFLSGVSVCREIPIFGSPFGEDIFIMGIIDEIRCDPQTFELELLEFKTRSHKSLPSKAQKNAHNLQVMLYKKLFDDLVTGQLTKEVIAKNLRLDLSVKFSQDILSEVWSQGHECCDLNELLDVLFIRMQCMTCINSILIEYCYQGDKSTIAFEQVLYDEVWFRSIFENFAKFWKGKRDACGVDIEDAWKCQRCDFADICEWRKKKAEECRDQNKVKK